MTVLIAGGGIAGMALALTCHQIGVPVRVFESVTRLAPLGVGINLQPSAVRELIELGLGERLDSIGVRTRDYGMYTRRGLHIWTEPRGLDAGYRWPQYSVHRGQLHMLLYEELLRRAGPDVVELGWSATGFDHQPDAAVLHLRHRDGRTRSERGALLVGADGIHSAIRHQMVPDEGSPKWGGALLWRGTSVARPFKTGASMVMIGHSGLRFVSYPIGQPDPQTGLQLINWIANLNHPPGEPWNKEDWNREANLADFLPRFEGMVFDWLDVPALVQSATKVFEYPMVDRDPLPQWTRGRVTLMGDAAHAAYPVGSNGAGSAIIDARQIGRALLDHGLTPAALQAYEDKMRPITTQVVLTNRVAGPDHILDIVQERCDGWFEHIDDVISQQELADHASRYKAIAGYAIDAINAAPPTIAPGERVPA
ncbi:flavin-dependent oxidoreductase [Ottowia sp.]|uniref:flavin-dependent oxidoreductase n=1 Tax=Ottowia sp. TaxID=1898956 RepID=UPI002CE27FB2|nr:flavin-dependent oxidoreductase [Ottowia sp.]HOB66040.1 flavin-dependent oxidoreductase [Ottowia sp.]HPZ56060.1 flavin-dependent oxidoreductase [Ottowia sp.]HQD48609.1 flavin-dependent oxidoreductase [Ottowia sp.]